MKKTIGLMIGAMALASVAGSNDANAFNCTVPAFVSPTKQSVCSTPALRRLDQEHDRAYSTLRRRLDAPSRTAFTTDYQSFIDVRGRCAADLRCLEATYRAQIRLYEKLTPCASAPGNQRVCVTRTISAHREELHRSM